MARKIWTTQDGRKMKMQAMTFSHMVNALNMMIKSAHEQVAAIEEAMNESLFPENTSVDWRDYVSDRGVALAKVYAERVSPLSKALRKRLNLQDDLIMELASLKE